MVVFILIIISINVVQWKNKIANVGNDEVSGYNNSTNNKDMISKAAFLFVVGVLLFLTAIGSFADSTDILSNPGEILAKVINYSVAYGSIFVVMVLLPGLTILNNPKMRTFVKEEIRGLF